MFGILILSSSLRLRTSVRAEFKIRYQPWSIVSSPFIPSQPRCSSLPTTDLKPIRCLSPLLRDVGSPQWMDMGGWNKRGYLESGRPRQCVTRMRQMKVMSRFHCSYLSNTMSDKLGPRSLFDPPTPDHQPLHLRNQ